MQNDRFFSQLNDTDLVRNILPQQESAVEIDPSLLERLGGTGGRVESFDPDASLEKLVEFKKMINAKIDERIAQLKQMSLQNKSSSANQNFFNLL
ncbi:MAG: hypothetical protein HQK50_09285 [Oligoflexia bacterium]|nr:hypothetical protein [Oligoflexia bacterium]